MLACGTRASRESAGGSWGNMSVNKRLINLVEMGRVLDIGLSHNLSIENLMEVRLLT